MFFIIIKSENDFSGLRYLLGEFESQLKEATVLEGGGEDAHSAPSVYFLRWLRRCQDSLELLSSWQHGRRKETRKKEKEEGEARKNQLVEKVQRKDRTFLDGEDERRKERKRRPKENQTSQSETSPVEVWMALSPFALGADLAVSMLQWKDCREGRR